MDILYIITKKAHGKELTKEEIAFFVNEYCNKNIQDYQASALIMAIFLKGMTKRETVDLTIAMANSGKILDLSDVDSIIVDKHSTGGVGDKVSIILCPLIASLGIKMAKISGRGLGFTGGTVDKLESIPGFNTKVSIKELKENLKKSNVSMIAQTPNIAPADKKIYALRDATSCVENIPLIVSSIMSKKIAMGANKIVIDITVGEGAFMKTMEQGEILAKEMIEIGKMVNREVSCVLTNMNEPLGKTVGNNLEIIEAIEFLKGNMAEDVKEVVFELGNKIMQLVGYSNDVSKNKEKLLENIKNGKAYEKFIELVQNQGGDISYIKDTNKFEKSKYIEPIIAEKDGFIEKIHAKEVGKCASIIGAGRLKKEDEIDTSAGIVFKYKVGDEVKKGETIAYYHTNKIDKIEEAKKRLNDAIIINDTKVDKKSPILKIIDK